MVCELGESSRWSARRIAEGAIERPQELDEVLALARTNVVWR